MQRDGSTLEQSGRFSVLLFFAMLYVTLKLSCNPMFFRQTVFFYPILGSLIKVTCSGLLFPAIYIISDVITYLTSRKTAICIILFGIFCDGVFSYSMNFVVHASNPTMELSAIQRSFLNSVNHVGMQMWSLYCSGVIATVIATVGEILVFSFIFKKVNSFFMSTFISIVIILFLHNSITDYPMLKNEFDVWHIISGNLIMEMSVMLIYVSVVSLLMKIFKLFYFKQ